MALTVEELQLEISDNAKSAANGLDLLQDSLKKIKSAASGSLGLKNLSKNLSELNQAANSINEGSIKKISELAAALQPLSTLGRAQLTSFINQLGKLPKVMSDLKAADIEGFTNNIAKLNTAIAPFANNMNKIGNAFANMPSKISKVASMTDKYHSSNNRLVKSGSGLFNFLNSSKLNYLAVAMALKKVSTYVSDWIVTANDYIENMNLFNVAMGQYAEEATKYAQTIEKVMGIDMSEWIRNQGVFMQIASGFGVVSDKAYTMSQGLTQVAYDISSFFNIDVSTALEKVRAGISGELEPLTLAA